jgi:hypothetical protein
MDVKAIDEKQAVRYLLGELTEAEQVRLEELFFHDSELSELLSEAEDDLVDQYVRQELSGRERKRFEDHFLISERRREKVGFAKALLQAETAKTAPEAAHTEKPLSRWQVILAALRPLRPALSYSLAAAALLFLLGGLWLFSEIRQLRREVARMEAEREGRERQNDQLREQDREQRRRSDELAAQNEKLEQELALLKQRADIPDTEPRVAPSLPAFILSPGYRGSEGPKNLVLPPLAQTFRLQLNLNADDRYPSYRVRLQTASGELVRSWNQLSASSRRGPRVVLLTVPARLLSAGKYELTLSGVAGPDRTDDLGYYYFNFLKE